MIKTLRITSVLAAALAVVVFSFSVVYGMRGDPAIEEFLRSPGVMARFNQAPGARTPRAANQISPLVEQAQRWASVLNPPPPPRQPVSTPRTITPSVPKTIPRGPVSAKFDVIATSVHKSDPNMSLALINEPGKGMSWIRQSSKIMHLDIVEIKDDVVVLRDGQRTFEQVAVPRQPTISLEVTPGNAAVTTSSATSPTTVVSSVTRTQRTALPPRTTVRETPAPEPVISEHEDAALNSLVERLKNLRRDGDSGDVDQAVDDLMSNFRTPEVGPEEAEQLDHLGDELKGGDREEPNVPRRPSSKIDNRIPRRPPVTSGRTPTRP